MSPQVWIGLCCAFVVGVIVGALMETAKIERLQAKAIARVAQEFKDISIVNRFWVAIEMYRRGDLT